jgi:DNA-binding CsgD family transcriptional regulator
MLEKLSPRQAQVLNGMVRGLKTKEIAAELGITSGAIGIYSRYMYAKLQVHNRAQAVAYYNRYHGNGLSLQEKLALAEARAETLCDAIQYACSEEHSAFDATLWLRDWNQGDPEAMRQLGEWKKKEQTRARFN